jgi:hypothetical protein
MTSVDSILPQPDPTQQKADIVSLLADIQRYSDQMDPTFLFT